MGLDNRNLQNDGYGSQWYGFFTVVVSTLVKLRRSHSILVYRGYRKRRFLARRLVAEVCRVDVLCSISYPSCANEASPRLFMYSPRRKPFNKDPISSFSIPRQARLDIIGMMSKLNTGWPAYTRKSEDLQYGSLENYGRRYAIQNSQAQKSPL